MHAFRLLALLVLMSTAATALAQDAQPLTEAAFWQQLTATRNELEAVVLVPAAQRRTTMERIGEQWEDMTQVQLDSGEVIRVDTAWVRLTPETDGATIQETIRRIDALRSFDGQPGISIAAAPTIPQQEQARREVRLPPWLDDVFRFLLVTMGIVLVAVTLFFVARGLRLTTAITKSGGDADPDDDPQTADDARSRAKSSEQSQDYRTAVRYLYLASLLRLDEAGLIRYDPTLTNQEHLSQIDDHPNVKDLLTPIIHFFDRTWYGFATISDEDYRQFRNMVDRLNSMAAKRPS